MTWLCSLFLISLVFCFKETVLTAVLAPTSVLAKSESSSLLQLLFSNENDNTCVHFSYVSLPAMTTRHPTTRFPVDRVMSLSAPCLAQLPVICLVLYKLSTLRLSLSGDVEKNPGPDPDSSSKPTASKADVTEVIIDSIKNLELSLQAKLDNVLRVVNNQATTLQRQEELLQKMRNEQLDIRQKMDSLHKEVEETKAMSKSSIDSVCALTDECNKMTDTINALETEVDRLESYSRRNNVKLFGIPEAEGYKEDCAEAARNILLTYLPDKEWTDDVIERAHRVGKRNHSNDNPRPIIATFKNWGDVMTLMTNRDARADMKNDGLRAAQDLTKRQSTKLRKLYEEGRPAYYVNGKLRFQTERRDRGNDRLQNANGNANNERGHPHYHTQLSTAVNNSPVTDTPSEPISGGGIRGPRTRSVTQAEREHGDAASGTQHTGDDGKK